MGSDIVDFVALCKNCASPLNKHKNGKFANRCAVCQGWQTKRRYLDLSNVVLAGVASFVSVAIAFYAPAHSLLKDKAPELNLSILITDYQSMSFIMSNTGTAPAGIVEMYVSLDDQESYNIPIGKEYWGTILDKGKAESFKVSSVKTTGLPILANPDHKGYAVENVTKCRLVLTYKDLRTNFNKNIVSDFECYNFSPLPSTIERRKFS